MHRSLQGIERGEVGESTVGLKSSGLDASYEKGLAIGSAVNEDIGWRSWEQLAFQQPLGELADEPLDVGAAAEGL
jgi:hypothetical protein